MSSDQFTNPLDALEVALDLVRRDETTFMFMTVSNIKKEAEANKDGWSTMGAGDEVAFNRGFIQGLTAVLDELDARIGWLRDKWQ